MDRIFPAFLVFFFSFLAPKVFPQNKLHSMRSQTHTKPLEKTDVFFLCRSHTLLCCAGCCLERQTPGMLEPRGELMSSVYVFVVE
uniref:Putative secreted peptide n=1 Tax=Anopheles braziliensis TaxID=58242 RepID=A0A2M3ZT13_9DIPT